MYVGCKSAVLGEEVDLGSILAYLNNLQRSVDNVVKPILELGIWFGKSIRVRLREWSLSSCMLQFGGQQSDVFFALWHFTLL